MVGRRRSNQKKISGVLPEMVRDNGWEQQLDLHSIFPRWEEIVGEEMSENARPLKIERNVLWLEVANSAWLQQYQYEKLELLDTLNSCFRLSRLDDIKMVLPKGRKGKKGKEGQNTFGKKSAPAVEFVRPSEEKVAAFQKQVGCIADEKCREALMQFWYLAQACKRKTD